MPCGCHLWLLVEAELASITPHATQDHGKLSRHRDTCPSNGAAQSGRTVFVKLGAPFQRQNMIEPGGSNLKARIGEWNRFNRTLTLPC
jgi:hypothetical protein